MNQLVQRFLFVLLITSYVNGQSIFDVFGSNNQNSIGSNQQRPRTQQRQQNYQRNSRPQLIGGRDFFNDALNNAFNDASFRNIPGAFNSLNSITNPGSRSSNNAIGNTAYVGNSNSVIHNNPQ